MDQKNTPKHWYIASLRALYAHSKQKTFTGTARAPRASSINLLVAKCTVHIAMCTVPQWPTVVLNLVVVYNKNFK